MTGCPKAAAADCCHFESWHWQLAQQRREKQLAEKRLQKELHDAAYDGRLERVQEIVTMWTEECFSDLIGAKLDCVDHEGNTALSEAACGGHPDVCKLLLRHGAQINHRSQQGRTPLWRAAFVNHYETAELLLAHGGGDYRRVEPLYDEAAITDLAARIPWGQIRASRHTIWICRSSSRPPTP